MSYGVDLRAASLRAAVCALSLILAPRASAAPTMTTDAGEHAAGDVAVVSGSGWQPGEVIEIEIAQDPELHPVDLLYTLADAVIADEMGHFHSGYVVPGYDEAQIFTVTATGVMSGQTVQTWFTNELDFMSLPVPPVSSEEPMVTTDKPDYYPGETAVITGAGWLPGEVVALEFAEEPVSHPAELLHAIADQPDGKFVAGYVLDDHDFGHLFTLT